MEKQKEIKILLINKLDRILDEQIELSKEQIALVSESKRSDTKSSAGDKFETGRSMMQFELDKIEAQCSILLKHKNDLSQISFSKENEMVELGSIVKTEDATYFISVGLGKIDFQGDIYYAISFASPIGKLLYGKRVGDEFKFNKKSFLIKEIA